MASVDPRWIRVMLGPLRAGWLNRQLIRKLVVREIASRYRGALGGFVWSLAQPLAMLAIYGFVFSIIFRSRWSPDDNVANVSFAVILFVGLLVNGAFAECLNRAPGLVIAHAMFVKKVVFPLEILPYVVLGSALFAAGVNIFVLLMAMLLTGSPLHPTMLLFPLVIAPLLLLSLGVCWTLSALGVFLRDIGQIVGLVATALFFLAPIVYPMSAVPEGYRWILYLNPLTFPVEQSRDVLIWGRLPNWGSWAISLIASWIIAALSLAFFQRIRKGFADVL